MLQLPVDFIPRPLRPGAMLLDPVGNFHQPARLLCVVRFWNYFKALDPQLIEQTEFDLNTVRSCRFSTFCSCNELRCRRTSPAAQPGRVIGTGLECVEMLNEIARARRYTTPSDVTTPYVCVCVGNSCRKHGLGACALRRTPTRTPRAFSELSQVSLHEREISSSAHGSDVTTAIRQNVMRYCPESFEPRVRASLHPCWGFFARDPLPGFSLLWRKFH